MHQSQTSGGDSWFPLRMGYTGTTHGGRAVNRAPGRQFMADEHSAGNEHTEPAAPADRPGAPSSPWEPAGPVGPGAPSPWAPAPTSPWAAPAPPPPPPTPAPEPPSPPPAAAPVEAPGPAESWDNPLSGPAAGVLGHHLEDRPDGRHPGDPGQGGAGRRFHPHPHAEPGRFPQAGPGRGRRNGVRHRLRRSHRDEQPRGGGSAEH